MRRSDHMTMPARAISKMQAIASCVSGMETCWQTWLACWRLSAKRLPCAAFVAAELRGRGVLPHSHPSGAVLAPRPSREPRRPPSLAQREKGHTKAIVDGRGQETVRPSPDLPESEKPP